MAEADNHKTKPRKWDMNVDVHAQEEEEPDEGALGFIFSSKCNRSSDFEITAFGRPISIEQDSRMHLGGRVWKASSYLARYLEELEKTNVDDDDVLRGKHILELGAGTGLLGICASLSNASKVTITDKEDLLAQICANVEKNGKTHQEVKCKCVVGELDWTKFADDEDLWHPEQGQGTKLAKGCDIVLAADCIYFPELYEPFIGAHPPQKKNPNRSLHAHLIIKCHLIAPLFKGTLNRICEVNASSQEGEVIIFVCNDDGRTSQRALSEEGGQRWDSEFFQMLSAGGFHFERVMADQMLPPQHRNEEMRLFKVRRRRRGPH